MDARRRALLRNLARVLDAAREAGAEVQLPGDGSAPAVELPHGPRKVGEGVSLSDRVYIILRERPRMPIKDLAVTLYGVADKKTAANVRSLLDQLKRRNLVRNTGVGEWEAIEG